MRGLHGDTTGHSLILLNIKLNPNNAAEISLSEYSSWLEISCLVWVSVLYKCYAFIFFSYVIWRNILNKEVTFYSIPRTEVAQKGGKMMLFVGPQTRGEYPAWHGASAGDTGRVIEMSVCPWWCQENIRHESLEFRRKGLVLMFINGMELNFPWQKCFTIEWLPPLPPPAPHSPHKMMSIESPFSV